VIFLVMPFGFRAKKTIFIGFGNKSFRNYPGYGIKIFSYVS
jgi:hypothetical protein